jgi:hypothetical protein
MDARVARERAVPINQGLVSEAFDPEQIRAMGAAFDHACRSLRLNDTNDPLTKLIAGKIVEAAQSGERDAIRLYDSVMLWASAA